MKNFHLYLLNHTNLAYLAMVVVILVFILISMSKNYRLLVQKLIYKAEIGKLAKNKMYDAVVRLEQSELDDRMILVLAELMQQIPVLPLIIPKRILIPLLQRSVQRIFNQIKKLLDANTGKDDCNKCKEELVIQSAIDITQKEELIKEITKRVENALKGDLEDITRQLVEVISNTRGK